jgi:hypothetical protein
LFVGSGVVEAGCKIICGQRLKLSGMHWTVRGANAIIALRCCQLSARWEEFWEARASVSSCHPQICRTPLPEANPIREFDGLKMPIDSRPISGAFIYRRPLGQ